MNQFVQKRKLPFVSKFAYGLGDVGCNFSWMFVSNFIMIFYTDVFQISMGAVAVLMLLSKAWGAITDPIVGGLSDKTQSKLGRYRPWLLYASPVAAVMLVLTFWAHPQWSETAKITYMAVTFCLLMLCYTSVNIPYGTMLGVMTQDIDERASLNTYRSVSAMTAIGIINIITIPLIGFFGGESSKDGYLWVAICYGAIFAICHLFCFSKTREVVEAPPKQELPLRVQLKAAARNKPYLLALIGQVLFGFVLYTRNADMLYYFTYVEGNAGLFAVYAIAIIVPSILGAGCFPLVFKWTQNKGRTAAIFAFGTGITMSMLFFFSPNSSAIAFYTFAILSQFLFSGFNTAIYAVIPDCVEYGEWRSGMRNDGFQYAFISLGNKIGLALGTALLAFALGASGYVANAVQNPVVIAVMKHSFSTIPGILWIIIGIAFLFYKLDKRTYNRIVEIIEHRKLQQEKSVDAFQVVALGELLIDFYQQELDGSTFRMKAGGAPHNVLAMLSNLGKRTVFIGKIGDDFLGDAIEKDFTRSGISRQALVKAAAFNTTLAFVKPKVYEKHEFVFYRKFSADIHLMPTDINLEVFFHAKVFHFGSMSLTHRESRNATKRAVGMAKYKRCFISFAPNYRPFAWNGKDPRKQMRYGCSVCDLLTVNEAELRLITGMENLAEGVKWLMQKYTISILILTSGIYGSKAFTRDSVVKQNAFAINSIDTAQAGDMFVAACLDYLLDNGFQPTEQQLQDMLQYASAAAALGTTNMAYTGVRPTRSQIADFLKIESKN
ncbi:glycoside-pentoside-hexuronide (GPH):cation symporter [Sphingobacterium oryzagri]|uniref:Glycoside-pentoside-hexuronide (GPH):cation symporter n=1 Tax=Sphingobacterium oryzagri TaxID=3025669 RepID=A0ABY7WCF6_9SPHI|nr:glycoside-pentoside-hexuronide (GPH):cation symporter [Sphingobacterium sp. KACC 22765]WDF67338.1 glycoside-pentoside-hexuronide (GPH):cation symporter [Sphingobacterium sp. KACC 22765]